MKKKKFGELASFLYFHLYSFSVADENSVSRNIFRRATFVNCLAWVYYKFNQFFSILKSIKLFQNFKSL